jgi:hypothetical protein
VPDLVELSPARFAALVAPAVSRVFVAGIESGRAQGGRELVGRYGGPSAAGNLIEFRTSLAWPGRAVSRTEAAGVCRYRDLDEFDRTVDEHVQHGMLERTDDGGFRATERGLEFLTELYDLHGRATGELWKRQQHMLGRLVPALGTLVRAATVTGGDAFAAMTPVWEPRGAPAGLLVFNRLSALRYHRADAHAAAWTAAGLTAAEMVTMKRDRDTDPIEAETNRRAAAPFRVLPAADRIALLADLAALPG